MAAPSVAGSIPASRVIGHVRWSRMAATGLVMMGVASLAVLAMALATGSEFDSFAAMAVLGGCAALVCAVLVWRFGTWAKAVSIVMTLAVVVGTFFVAFGIFAPFSVTDFLPGLTYVLGFFLSLGGCIAAIVRRTVTEEHAGRGERRILLGVGVVLVVGLVGSGIATAASRTTVAATAAAGAIPTTMDDFAFAEEIVRVPANTLAQLLAHNSDPFTHNVTIDELGVNAVTVTPGSAKLIDLTAPPGQYKLYCSLHPGMETTLIAE